MYLHTSTVQCTKKARRHSSADQISTELKQDGEAGIVFWNKAVGYKLKLHLGSDFYILALNLWGDMEASGLAVEFQSHVYPRFWVIPKTTVP